MKINEIRQKNKEQIEKLIHDQREKLKDLMFGSAGAREKNVKLQKTLKKDIARFLTVLNEGKKVVVAEVKKEVKKAEVKVKKVVKVAKKTSTKK
jgi:ribosomal protein L29